VQSQEAQKPTLKTASLLVAALTGTFLSILLQGFIAGISNNYFHYSIVDDLYNDPAFQSDEYIQSLRHFFSGLWIAVKLVFPKDNFFSVFLLLHILGRFLAFLGFLLCAKHLGLSGVRQTALLTLFIAVTPLMRGGSVAGNSGLFSIYFSHSDMGIGLTLICLYLLISQRLIATLALNGVLF